MDDPELQAVRSKRKGEMEQEKQSAAMVNQKERQKQVKDNAAKEEEMKNAILSQVLDQNARARLSNIAVAKPEKAKMLENTIINMARFGQITGKLTDEQLKTLLNRMSEQTHKETKVNFDRRRNEIDSDSD